MVLVLINKLVIAGSAVTVDVLVKVSVTKTVEAPSIDGSAVAFVGWEGWEPAPSTGQQVGSPSAEEQHVKPCEQHRSPSPAGPRQHVEGAGQAKSEPSFPKHNVPSPGCMSLCLLPARVHLRLSADLWLASLPTASEGWP